MSAGFLSKKLFQFNHIAFVAPSTAAPAELSLSPPSSIVELR